MGRMLDVLSPSSRPDPDVVRFPTPKAAPLPTPNVEEAHEPDAVAFIEVGGPTMISSVGLPPIKPLASTPPKKESEPIHRASPGIVGAIGTTLRELPGLFEAGPARGPGFGPGVVAFHAPDHPVAEGFRESARQLATQLNASSRRVVGLMGVAAKCGTTTAALNLGVTLARAGGRVLVIDANAARPFLASMAGLSPYPGLREAMDRRTPFSLAARPTAQSGLSVMPCGAPMPEGEPLTPDRLERVMKVVRERYDWTIFDLPDWGQASAQPWADAVGACYLVVREGDWDAPDVGAAHEALASARAGLRGYLLSREAG